MAFDFSKLSMDPMFQVGLSLMSRPTPGGAMDLGGGFNQGMKNVTLFKEAEQRSRYQDMVMARVQAEMAAKQAAQARAEERQRQLGAYIQTLPPGQRAIAAANPEEFIKQQAKSMFEKGTTLEQNAQAAGLTPGTPEYQQFIANEVQGVLSPSAMEQQLKIAGEEARITTEAEAATRAAERQAKYQEELLQKQGSQQRATQAEGAKGAMLEELIEEAKANANIWSTGFLGQRLQDVGGTQAMNLASTLSTIKANLGFDKLQAMRDASPTGGALGQVSERELAFLQDVWGSLNQAQTREQFVKSLDRVKEAVTASWERVYDAYADEYGEPHPDDPRVKDVSGQTTAPPQGNDPLGIL